MTQTEPSAETMRRVPGKPGLLPSASLLPPRKELVFSQMHRPIQRDKATSPWYPAAEDDPCFLSLDQMMPVGVKEATDRKIIRKDVGERG